MAQRKAWADLSPAYQRRLERRGITAKSHASANLIRARGHQVSRPAGAAPEDLVTRLVNPGQASVSDFRTAASKFTRPSWVPKDAPVDVAAALSQLPPPSRWTGVEFTPRGNEEAWTMTVHLKGNAYDREILIPGGGGPGTGAKSVLDIVTDLRDGRAPLGKKPSKSRQQRLEEMFLEVHESP